MAEYPVLPPGLAALGATQASHWRNIIMGVVGAVLVLLCVWALVNLRRGAASAESARSEHLGLMLSAGVGVVIGSVLVALAVANSREAARARRLVQGQLLPGEVIEFGADAMLPDQPPADGPDLFADWRIVGLRRAILLVTDQRLLVLPGRGLATTAFAWRRDRIGGVTGRVEGHRAVLSAQVRGEGRLELWVRGYYDLNRARAALGSCTSSAPRNG
jgi:hypothetical protein